SERCVDAYRGHRSACKPVRVTHADEYPGPSAGVGSQEPYVHARHRTSEPTRKARRGATELGPQPVLARYSTVVCCASWINRSAPRTTLHVAGLARQMRLPRGDWGPM